jgi:hypothetical protein
MKYALALICIISFGSQSMAQQVCGKRDEILKTLAAPKYQETPVGHGLGGDSSIIELLRDADDGSWTVIQTTIYSKHFRKTCIIAAGRFWEFVWPTMETEL